MGTFQISGDDSILYTKWWQKDTVLLSELEMWSPDFIHQFLGEGQRVQLITLQPWKAVSRKWRSFFHPHSFPCMHGLWPCHWHCPSHVSSLTSIKRKAPKRDYSKTQNRFFFYYYNYSWALNFRQTQGESEETCWNFGAARWHQQGYVFAWLPLCIPQLCQFLCI